MTATVLDRQNRVVRAARRRADELEPRLARQLVPVLRSAGLTAARAFGDKATDHLTASGDPTWTAPAADEIIDVEALVAKLKAKTDPIRRAVVETMIDATVAGTGVSFDVTHPLVGAVLARSVEHVGSIAATTRAAVMRTISASHREGLSIPETAKVLRSAMRDAAPERAVTIARSELTSAVNGAALAATRVVSSATGETYFKRWLATEDERTRLDHADADGQVVPLDQSFQVGGVAMDAPGDPSAPGDETANCRCAISFTDEPPR